MKILLYLNKPQQRTKYGVCLLQQKSKVFVYDKSNKPTKLSYFEVNVFQTSELTTEQLLKLL